MVFAHFVCHPTALKPSANAAACSPVTSKPNECISDQGDQIGRIFTDWAITYFCQFFKIYKSCQNVLGTFSTEKVIYQFLTKNVLGCNSCEFFYKLIWSPRFRSSQSGDLFLSGDVKHNHVLINWTAMENKKVG
jgi:hypothetical protein